VDISDTATYSISGGNDSALFSITSGGVLTFNTSPNFEIPTDFDGNGIYEVQVTANDGNGGTDTQSISITVTNAEDTPIGSITIDNTVPFEGDTLTASNNLFDEDGISGSISFQWLRNGSSIFGATSNIYMPVQADVGMVLSVVASFTDNLGNSYTFTSSSTSLVNTAAVSDDTTSPPSDDPDDTEYENEEPENGGDFNPAVEDDTEMLDFEDDTDMPDFDENEISNLSSLLNEVILTPVEDAIGERYEEEVHSSESNGHYNSLPPKFIDLAQLDISNFESDNQLSLPLESVTLNNSFVEELFKLSRELDEAFENEKEQYRLGSEVAVGTAVSLTAGIVSWILRSGSLIASLMSVAPVWRQLDPMHIVGSNSVEKRKERERREEDEEDENNNTNVENIFDD